LQLATIVQFYPGISPELWKPSSVILYRIKNLEIRKIAQKSTPIKPGLTTDCQPTTDLRLAFEKTSKKITDLTVVR
jgi:hypothetical protein